MGKPLDWMQWQLRSRTMQLTIDLGPQSTLADIRAAYAYANHTDDRRLAEQIIHLAAGIEGWPSETVQDLLNQSQRYYAAVNMPVDESPSPA